MRFAIDIVLNNISLVVPSIMNYDDDLIYDGSYRKIFALLP